MRNNRHSRLPLTLLIAVGGAVLVIWLVSLAPRPVASTPHPTRPAPTGADWRRPTWAAEEEVTDTRTGETVRWGDVRRGAGGR